MLSKLLSLTAAGASALVTANQAAKISLGYTRGEAVHVADIDFVDPFLEKPRRLSRECNGTRQPPASIPEHEIAASIPFPDRV